VYDLDDNNNKIITDADDRYTAWVENQWFLKIKICFFFVFFVFMVFLWFMV